MLSGYVEIWDSEGVTLNVVGATGVGTVQIDRCDRVEVAFTQVNPDASVVFSATEAVVISAGEGEDRVAIETGTTDMRERLGEWFFVGMMRWKFFFVLARGLGCLAWTHSSLWVRCV